ncbi:MAG: methylated-DNA--[protein]-cysteine S-methyltransferase [Desulfobacteraceae bacterium]|nr:methylated-DNA--[protein]-cysteine S-methyltransferase [Desulfobacteraceae bacterium]
MAFIDIDNWLGTVRVVFEPDPFRVLRIYLPETFSAVNNGTNFCVVKEKAISSDAHTQAQALSRLILDYFDNKKPIETPWQWLCFRRQTLLEQWVLKITAAIPFGSVRSYGDIAAAAGRPGAGRFVGNTMVANPFPLIIPCHRVIKSNGSTGGFGGGAAMKIRLLKHEGYL